MKKGDKVVFKDRGKLEKGVVVAVDREGEYAEVEVKGSVCLFKQRELKDGD